jgi:hypothetical protein
MNNDMLVPYYKNNIFGLIISTNTNLANFDLEVKFMCWFFFLLMTWYKLITVNFCLD